MRIFLFRRGNAPYATARWERNEATIHPRRRRQVWLLEFGNNPYSIPFVWVLQGGLLSKAVGAHLLPKRELSVGAVEPWRGCDGITAV
jgi:hypothetical protein